MSGLIGVNMTNFFNRELFMYSLGDIKFKKPISLKKVAYTMGFLILWTLPLYLIFGLKLSPFYFVLLLAPPFVAGHFATKPAFGGKTLIDFTKTMFKFAGEPKGWLDLRNDNGLGKEVYYVENEIWIGRRRELQLLADIQEDRVMNRKRRK